MSLLSNVDFCLSKSCLPVGLCSEHIYNLIHTISSHLPFVPTPKCTEHQQQYFSVINNVSMFKSYQKTKSKHPTEKFPWDHHPSFKNTQDGLTAWISKKGLFEYMDFMNGN